MKLGRTLLVTKTPYELFDDVVHHLIDLTNKNAVQNNEHWSVEKNELRFIGILVVSGFHMVPGWNLYWSLLPEFCVKMVNNSLKRKTIRDIIHLAYNDNLHIAVWKLHMMVCKTQNTKPLPQLDFKAEIVSNLILTEAPVSSSSAEYSNIQQL